MKDMILVLGASANPHRYSFKAVNKLKKAGYQVIPVSPKGGVIEGLTVLQSLDQVAKPVDTVTIYINPSLLNNEIEKVIALQPRRVVFNPGTEHPVAQQKFAEQNIEVVQDCTLIMLDNHRF